MLNSTLSNRAHDTFRQFLPALMAHRNEVPINRIDWLFTHSIQLSLINLLQIWKPIQFDGSIAFVPKPPNKLRLLSRKFNCGDMEADLRCEIFYLSRNHSFSYLTHKKMNMNFKLRFSLLGAMHFVELSKMRLHWYALDEGNANIKLKFRYQNLSHSFSPLKTNARAALISHLDDLWDVNKKPSECIWEWLFASSFTLSHYSFDAI